MLNQQHLFFASYNATVTFFLTYKAQLFERRLALNPGFFFSCSKAFSWIIFSAIIRASNHQLVDKKNKTEMFFKLSNLNSNLNSNLSLTLGYLNPALNNSVHPTSLEWLGSATVLSLKSLILEGKALELGHSDLFGSLCTSLYLIVSL